MYDFEHSIDEDCFIAIGLVGDLLFVAYIHMNWIHVSAYNMKEKWGLTEETLVNPRNTKPDFL